MNVNRKTIFRLKQRLHETDTVRGRPRSGRPRCTTQRQDRNLVRNHMNNRLLSASASSRQTRGRNNQRSSAKTVRRRLSTSGLRARRPYIGPILTQRHRHQRTLWAQEHGAWDRIQWRSVVFSVESRFCTDHADGRVRVWRRSGGRYQAHCVREHDRWGGAYLMMWGAISYNDRIGPVFSTIKDGRLMRKHRKHTCKMCFRLMWCLTPPCIKILFFN
ncbi:transposable element Tcb1 transposase [Elysia marginata]|uniref:Transposable element Tcb1 transposase n=1 Tax=Elysia marginata TaxID=1093978 RepID=A0AAV4H3K5_9GAST|nr:transposable element Tcb1 transposase [Elysia marginata]